MNVRLALPRLAVCLLGFACFHSARADTYTTSGTFSADNQVIQYNFSTATSQVFTLSTTSYAAGGFDPVLSLFDASGNPVDNSGLGGADASLMDTLAPGAYELTLTEFPNVAVGTLSQGFLFAGDPTATGDVCGVSGGMFLDSSVAPCVQRNGNYAFSVSSATSVAATPEPSSWLLMLSGVAMAAIVARRQRIA